MINAKADYWPQLDGMRTLAFAWVFFHHHGLTILPSQLEPATFPLKKLSEWGWLGVDLFFVLSAFLVTHLLCVEREKFGKISLPKFYARRALRIWPLLFLVLIGTCFIYPLFAPHKASHLYRLFLENLVLPLFTFSGNLALPWNFHHMVNYAKASGLEFFVFVTLLVPFWSLCIEEQFYALWGLSARIFNNSRKLLILTCVLLVVGCVARFVLLSTNRGVAHSVYYMHSFWHLETIMLGALLAIVGLQIPALGKVLSKGWLPPVLFVGSIIALFSAVMFGPSIESWDYRLAPLMTVISVAECTLVALALYWTPLSNILSNRVMVHLGKLTFGMYVFHFFVQWYVRNTFHVPIVGWEGLWSYPICFAATWAVAMVSWHVMEKPLNNLRRKLSRVHGGAEQSAPQPATEAAPVKDSEPALR